MGVTSSKLVGALIIRLHLAFPQRDLPPESFALYVQELADVPADVLEAVVSDLIRAGGDWFPSISAIRGAAAERTLALPSEPAALAQVEARIAWGRLPEETRGDQPPVHPLVRQALDHVGGFHGVRTAEEPGIVRAQFLRLYRELRSGQVREAQIGRPELAAGPARKEIGS